MAIEFAQSSAGSGIKEKGGPKAALKSH